jgi:DUF1365 family protein
MHSCLYTGQVRHRRFAEPGHEFSYRLFMAYLDLDELDTVFSGRWFWSTNRRTIAEFRRSDQMGDPNQPLTDAVRSLVERETGFRPAGPIRLLTHLRYFGYVFNPISVYFCFDPAGERVEAVAADVTNTPWNERHAYVLDVRGRKAGDPHAPRKWTFDKAFHVSPFFPMEMRYHWMFSDPGDTVVIHMDAERQGERVFDATLTLRRRPITGASLAGALLRFPMMTAQVMAAIHWQAFRLWWKGAKYVPHPKTMQPTAESSTHSVAVLEPQSTASS